MLGNPDISKAKVRRYKQRKDRQFLKWNTDGQTTYGQVVGICVKLCIIR